MHIYLLVNHFLFATPAPDTIPTLTSTSTSIVNVNTVTNNIRLFLAPLVLLIISIVAVMFLLKKQMKKFIEFAILAIATGVFFYTPGIVQSVATTISGLFGGK